MTPAEKAEIAALLAKIYPDLHWKCDAATRAALDALAARCGLPICKKV